ncbi:MAG: hypothetical protein AB8H12_02740 [Lewinella sp.]
MQSTKPTRADHLAWAAAFAGSGLTAQNYAAAAGCSVAKLYYWRAQLRENTSSSGFTTITLSADAPTALHLLLPGGIEVQGSITELVAFARQLDVDA